VDDRQLDLTRREFELLVTLAAHAGRTFDRGQLLEMVWGRDPDVHPRTVDSHIRVLRAKLGPTHRGLIRTARGVGYGMARQSVE
jgi:two-component system alkaline phosphatase synthesis response regulator PhoP